MQEPQFQGVRTDTVSFPLRIKRRSELEQTATISGFVGLSNTTPISHTPYQSASDNRRGFGNGRATQDLTKCQQWIQWPQVPPFPFDSHIKVADLERLAEVPTLAVGEGMV